MKRVYSLWSLMGSLWVHHRNLSVPACIHVTLETYFSMKRVLGVGGIYEWRQRFSTTSNYTFSHKNSRVRAVVASCDHVASRQSGIFGRTWWWTRCQHNQYSESTRQDWLRLDRSRTRHGVQTQHGRGRGTTASYQWEKEWVICTISLLLCVYYI